MLGKQFTLYMANRPGALSRIVQALASREINIEGISISAGTDVALVQIVVDDAARTRRVLRQQNAAFTVQDVVVVKLKNRPGELARGVAKLAKVGININYVYATACDCKGSCGCYAVISAPDLKAVDAAWKA